MASQITGNKNNVAFTTPVELPLILDNPDSANWSDKADIVLIGFGSAAAVAGLQAREDGASVIAVDRFGGGGSPSFVLMFMAIEPAYIEALKNNKDLFEYGYS